MKNYVFYEDPGHGWLRVPTLELVKLGIADKITPCSYIHPSGKWAYLEEDCDLTTFLIAKIYDYVATDWKDAAMKLNKEEGQKWFKENVEINDRATIFPGKDSFVRNFQNYNPPKPMADQFIDDIARQMVFDLAAHDGAA